MKQPLEWMEEVMGFQAAIWEGDQMPGALRQPIAEGEVMVASLIIRVPGTQERCS